MEIQVRASRPFRLWGGGSLLALGISLLAATPQGGGLRLASEASVPGVGWTQAPLVALGILATAAGLVLLLSLARRRG